MTSNEKTECGVYGYGGFRDSVCMVIVWDSHSFFFGYGMGMGIEIQSPRQPWFWQQRRTKFRPFDKVELLQIVTN